jgi:non-lysosomal glucosylceramidase
MKNKFIFLAASILTISISVGYAQEWPVLKHYDQEHTYKIALPVGGIGTGTVSLGGRGNLQDWEIMDRPAKGYNPGSGRQNAPFFTLYTEVEGKKDLRLLEGPVPFYLYEGSSGAVATNHGLPRFENVSFDAAYPFGQVNLSTPQLPLEVKVKAFNPLIPGDVDNSSIPMAVLDFEITNKSDQDIIYSVCGSMQNFIGENGTTGRAEKNKNVYRYRQGFSGIFMNSETEKDSSDNWGEMALVTTATSGVTYRTAWKPEHWGSSILDFWDDLSGDGKLENRQDEASNKPMTSLAVMDTILANESKRIRFLITWYFPNRRAWASEVMENFYSTKYSGAWDVAEKTIPRLDHLENKTIEFVKAFCDSDLPEVVKEAALFNISTLRTQTCFRLTDGALYAWEGCNDKSGCCFGSCTHVWNYEAATGFLFGDLAKTRRKIEFGFATRDDGLMSFRVNLPLNRIPEFSKAAADGQMGAIMKFYRDWQLSGNDDYFKPLYPSVKNALSYAWIEGGWDGNQDGVMEGVQHNTMDVEYYGPNPQMSIWYLGALRAMEEMAMHMNDQEMAAKCGKLFRDGSKWVDENLFNGEYYYHQIIVPNKATIPEDHLIGMGAADYGNPDYQLGEGCLVDQLVGQYVAHICNLGYLLDKEKVGLAHQGIMKYNYRESLSDHFNCFRSYALGNEAALLMASYPRSRPDNPFPYFTEVMTGFEYTAAVGMLYEGQTDEGLKCISNIRERYDGRKRSPFNEAECGHHYGRAMASWSALLALTGFHYSGIQKEITFNNITGDYFWSNGYAYGTVTLDELEKGKQIKLEVLNGNLQVENIVIENLGEHSIPGGITLEAGESVSYAIN